MALLGLAISDFIAQKPRSKSTIALLVMERDKDLGLVPCGQERLVQFQITNNNSRPLQVFGFAVT